MAGATEKTCTVCGWRIRWRKKRRRNWDSVRYCSDACRRKGLTATDRLLEAAILDLLRLRGSGKTICPSEAALRVAASPSGEHWRPLMPAARSAARRLSAVGAVEVVQGSRRVDPSTSKGPIRIRLCRRSQVSK